MHALSHTSSKNDDIHRKTMIRMQNSSTRLVNAMAKKLLILGLATALLGCGVARLGYRNGETVTYWWLNSYVDFDNAQKSWVREHIDERSEEQTSELQSLMRISYAVFCLKKK